MNSPEVVPSSESHNLRPVPPIPARSERPSQRCGGLSFPFLPLGIKVGKTADVLRLFLLNVWNLEATTSEAAPEVP